MLPATKSYRDEFALFESVMREQMLFFPADLEVKSYGAQVKSLAEDVGRLDAEGKISAVAFEKGVFSFSSKTPFKELKESIQLPSAHLSRSADSKDGVFTWKLRPLNQIELQEQARQPRGDEAALVSQALVEMSEAVIPALRTSLCESDGQQLAPESAEWNSIVSKAKAGMGLAESVDFLTKAEKFATDRKDDALASKIASVRGFAVQALGESKGKSVSENDASEKTRAKPFGKVMAWWDLSKWAKGKTCPRTSEDGGMVFKGDDGSEYICAFTDGKVRRISSATPDGKASRGTQPSGKEMKEDRDGNLTEGQALDWEEKTLWHVAVSFPISMKDKKKEIEKSLSSLADRFGGRSGQTSEGPKDFGFTFDFEEGDVNTGSFIRFAKKNYPEAKIEHDESDLEYPSDLNESNSVKIIDASKLASQINGSKVRASKKDGGVLLDLVGSEIQIHLGNSGWSAFGSISGLIGNSVKESVETDGEIEESSGGLSDRLGKAEAMLADAVKMSEPPFKKEAEALLMQVTSLRKKAAPGMNESDSSSMDDDMEESDDYQEIDEGDEDFTESAETGEALYAAIKKIVDEKKHAKIGGIMVDLFSASAMLQVLNAVNDANRAKLLAMPVAKMADVAFKIINKK